MSQLAPDVGLFIIEAANIMLFPKLSKICIEKMKGYYYFFLPLGS